MVCCGRSGIPTLVARSTCSIRPPPSAGGLRLPVLYQLKVKPVGSYSSEGLHKAINSVTAMNSTGRRWMIVECKQVTAAAPNKQLQLTAFGVRDRGVLAYR